MNDDQGNLFGFGAYGGYRYDDGPAINKKKTREVTDDAVERAKHLVSEERRAEMLRAIEQAARTMQFLFADDIWGILGEPKDKYDGSALGPVMRYAAELRIVRDAKRAERSRRPITHGKFLPVWESLVYQK